jgi:hypothetical protein
LLTEQALPPTGAIIPFGNPLAQFLVRHFAKLMGVSFFIHFVSSPNVQDEPRASRPVGSGDQLKSDP